jgi:predicted nucleic-acid-binding Zn-ribbon protein
MVRVIYNQGGRKNNMKFRKYLNEGTGLGADGLSKQRLKTLIYKETKKCTYNKLYKDEHWEGINCIWDIFNKLNLNWQLQKSEYKHAKDSNNMMPSSKEWVFEIMWDDNKGKFKKIGGVVTAAGAGTVDDPLSRYDVTLVLW